jgi:hypothetical protein
MKKQTFQLLNVTGSESDIKTFCEREIINHTERGIDYTFIRALYKSNLYDNVLYYQSKISLHPESKSDLYMRILKQKNDGDLKENLECERALGNPYVNARLDDIKILIHESTCILIAIDCLTESFPDIWLNYYLKEYENLTFSTNKATLSLELPYFKRCRVISYCEYLDGNMEEEELE